MSTRTLTRINIAFIVLLVLTCDAPPPRAARRNSRDTLRLIRADSSRDSVALRDSQRTASSAAADSDPPCFASHFGLPCK